MAANDDGAAAAALLLQWLDAHGPAPVMSVVLEQLEGMMDASATPAALPVSLQVDATALAEHDAALALQLLSRAGQLAAKAADLVNQQLALMQPDAAAAADGAHEPPLEPPTIRLHLQVAQPPLPLLSVPEVAQQAVANSSSKPPALPLPVSCLGVVTGMTPPTDVICSQRLTCHACGSTTDVTPQERSLPCCNTPRSEWDKEDVTGRVMVQAQMLWVSELSAATGGRGYYGVSRAPLQVVLPESLVSCASLGDVVWVIGHASIAPAAAATAGGSVGAGAASIQVAANNLQALLPHAALWASGPVQQQEESPLQHSWEVLTHALGYSTPLDPHLALALLLSAAGVGSKGQGAVNVLVLHQAFAPATPRLLREAAALLSPHSVAMSTQHTQLVVPIAAGSGGSGGSEAGAKAVFASTLLGANSGVATAELGPMTSKARQQLLQALQQRATPAPKDAPPGLSLPPLSATCWAAASWEEVCCADGGGGGSKPAGGGRGKKSQEGGSAYLGFDLCIGDFTVYEDDLWELLGVQDSSAPARHADSTTVLRRLIASAVCCERPVLTAEAQAFLGQYFLVVRQSVDCSSAVSKPHLLASVLRVAAAVARLHGRSSVQECPDAALAVVLMEQTLANKLGDAYHPLLDLPCDLNPSCGRTLDEQLRLLHSLIVTSFRQHGFVDPGHDDGAGPFGGGGGFFAASGEDEGWDASGCDQPALQRDGGAFLQPDDELEQ